MDENYYTRGEKEFLLKVAREVLEKYLRAGEKLEPHTINQKLWEKHGAFVSLHKDKELRGCIGIIEPVEPLILAVRDNVLAAAHDPRFEPVKMNKIAVILPELVEVPGGVVTIGSHRWPFDQQAFADERPRHPVTLSSFFLARYPVTNAEYGYFIQAGGYDTETYWTPTGWQWRQHFHRLC